MPPGGVCRRLGDLPGITAPYGPRCVATATCAIHGASQRMNLNVLLRGQSNAFMLGHLSGGAQLVTHRVEQLLGFDGVNDTVTLEFAAEQPGGNTANSGTSFLTDWLHQANGVWQVGALEQGLLNYVAGLPAEQRAEPTAVVWL